MNAFKLRMAAHQIHSGGIIAYPTEAVYGLGCDPFDFDAVTKLLALKQRPVEKGLILIAANFVQIEPLISPLNKQQKQILQKSWPGPTTWLIPASTKAPPWITGTHNSIALRITNHPLANSLCETVGHPIVSTSANISQQKPARCALDIMRYFGQELDYILTGPLGNSKNPTQIKDLLSGQTLRLS